MEKTNLLLFSRVKATVVRNGEPVVGAKIERSTFWNMEKYPRLDYTYTNERGEFEFSEVRGSADFGWLARLFNQPTISQRIYQLDPEFGEILLYAAARTNHEEAQETGYEVIEFACDTSSINTFDPMFQVADCKLRTKK